MNTNKKLFSVFNTLSSLTLPTFLNLKNHTIVIPNILGIKYHINKNYLY